MLAHVNEFHCLNSLPAANNAKCFPLGLRCNEPGNRASTNIEGFALKQPHGTVPHKGFRLFDIGGIQAYSCWSNIKNCFTLFADIVRMLAQNNPPAVVTSN